ncbi:MAG: sialate O-acetylesterase [Bacteroidota bacterium]
MPALFADHMVLQQQAMAPIWGRAAVGESIIVRTSWDELQLQTFADSKGRWRVDMATPAAGGPHWIEIRGENRIVLKDILIGEVWLASGQSNMNWPLSRSKDGEADIQQADHSTLRFFQVERDISITPRFECEGSWQVCQPETAGGFSGVAYHFARMLQDSLQVPVAIIQSTWGGTPAEAWTSRRTLERLPDFGPYLQRFDQSMREFRETGMGRNPVHAKSPTTLFNAMLKPLVPYALQGVIWYQGEANVSDPYLYESLFPAMIKDWRQQWGYRFSFFFAQLAPFNYEYPHAGAALRDAQRKSLNTVNTGMVVTLDVGNPDNIHPTDKTTVGQRFARLALQKNYGRKNLIASGPSYKGKQTAGQELILSFQQVGGGLMARDSLFGFEIAGGNGQFKPARARLEGNQVVLTNSDIAQPLHARYAFANGADASLFNSEGLPATSFRTDQLPLFCTQPLMKIKYARSRGFYETNIAYHQAFPSVIRYSLDGSEVDAASPIYQRMFRTPAPVTIKARAYLGEWASPFQSEMQLVQHLGIQSEIIQATPAASAYVGDWRDGIMGSDNYLDGYWAAWKGKDVELTIDLGSKTALNRLALNLLCDHRRRIYLPKEVRIEGSNNGRKFHPLFEKTYGELTTGGRFIWNVDEDLSGTKTRYLRLKLSYPGEVPMESPGAGESSWIFLDEWIVE